MLRGRDFYLLPGGRIEELEESSDTIKREVKEELGWSDLEFSFLAIGEEFVNDKGCNTHRLNIIYKAIYENDIAEKRFKGLEGDWINFEWIDIENIESCNIFPANIKKIILNNEFDSHFVANLIK